MSPPKRTRRTPGARSALTVALYLGRGRGGALACLMHAFEVLGDPVRRRILELLATGEHASGEAVEAIQVEVLGPDLTMC